MTKEVAVKNDADVIEKVLVNGDLSALSTEQRVVYYNKTCESLGLNPLTKPFDYITLNDKLTLYAKRDCTDQLRSVHGISITITDRTTINGVYVVTAKATNKEGREDESTGAVALEKEGGEWVKAASGKNFFKKDGTVIPLRGDELANALMKAETKAKRRVTLSICGLGLLDESEIDTIPSAIVGEPSKPVYAPTDPVRPHKDDYVIPATILTDGTLDFDEFITILETKVSSAQTANELSLWNRANAKTLKAMEKERPDLFIWFGEQYRKKSQTLV